MGGRGAAEVTDSITSSREFFRPDESRTLLGKLGPPIHRASICRDRTVDISSDVVLLDSSVHVSEITRLVLVESTHRWDRGLRSTFYVSGPIR